MKERLKRATKVLLGRDLPSTQSQAEHVTDSYALHSGERQVATTVENIRADHVARYELACSDIANEQGLLRTNLGLDIFCGTGYGSHLLASTLGCCVWGMDASTAAIIHAEEHFSSVNNFFSAKVFPFTLPNAIADFAVCLESIEHVEAHSELFSQLYTAVRPGGLCYVSVPNEARMPFHKEHFPFHFRHFTLDDLHTLAGNEGGKVEKVWSQDVYENRVDQHVAHKPRSDFEIREGNDGQWLVAKIRKT